MEKNWTFKVKESSSFLLLDEGRLEGASLVFSIDSHLKREELFTLPLPELEWGMSFSIQVEPALLWEFAPIDYAFVLTVKDRLFSGKGRKLSLPEAKPLLRPCFTLPPRCGKEITQTHCIYRL